MVTVSFCTMLESVTVPLAATTLFTRIVLDFHAPSEKRQTRLESLRRYQADGPPWVSKEDEVILVRVDDESHLIHFKSPWVLYDVRALVLSTPFYKADG
jgi:hypothetical protein